MEEIRWNFLVHWMKNQRFFWNVILKSRLNLMYNCSEQRSMRLNLKKAVLPRLSTHMNIQHLNDQILVQGRLSSFPTPYPPDPPKDIHLHVELDRVHAEDLVPDVGKHVARRDDAQPRGKLHHLLQKCVCWYLYFPSYLYFSLYLYLSLKPGFVVSISSRLKDHSWSRTWLFFAQEVPCPD